jgi:hypothetical protein
MPITNPYIAKQLDRPVKVQTEIPETVRNDIRSIAPFHGALLTILNNLISNLHADIITITNRTVHGDYADILSIILEPRPLTASQVDRLGRTTLGLDPNAFQSLRRHFGYDRNGEEVTGRREDDQHVEGTVGSGEQRTRKQGTKGKKGGTTKAKA